VTGRTEYCNFPEEVLDVPVVGGFSASDISTETIVDIEPDLVIGGSVYQAEIVDALSGAGLTAFIQEPASIVEIMDAMELLGSVTGYLDTTAEALNDMQARIDAVVEIASAIPEEERVSVFYEVWHDPYMTTSSQTFIGELIELAGGINIFADLEEDYPTVSTEEIVDSDPQVIIGPSSHGDQLTVEMISSREGWGDVLAVKNERIYVIDGDIVSRAGPRVVDALEAFALAMYPDYFGE
jgi:iron complex transport system substrate-binding protein